MPTPSMLETFILHEAGIPAQTVKTKWPRLYASWMDNVRRLSPWLRETDYQWTVDGNDVGVVYRHPYAQPRWAALDGGQDREEEEWLPADTTYSRDPLSVLTDDKGVDERKAMGLIKDGKVKVGGVVCKDPWMVIKGDSEVEVSS